MDPRYVFVTVSPMPPLAGLEASPLPFLPTAVRRGPQDVAANAASHDADAQSAANPHRLQIVVSPHELG
jgi:hypothetical protein